MDAEAEYLANYIGLEKLRLRHNTQVEFVAEVPYPEQPLPPLLLLPLVENCFKHAIGASGPNTIRISLGQTDAGLTLRTNNSIPPTSLERLSGNVLLVGSRELPVGSTYRQDVLRQLRLR